MHHGAIMGARWRRYQIYQALAISLPPPVPFSITTSSSAIAPKVEQRCPIGYAVPMWETQLIGRRGMPALRIFSTFRMPSLNFFPLVRISSPIEITLYLGEHGLGQPIC